MITAAEALERLKVGNERFVAGNSQHEEMSSEKRRQLVVAEQKPFAVILGCSDSRVPAEIVFDQGLGDLFVIRVAGNIVAPSQVGSIEFAVEQFGTPLVVVLGHSNCGAIKSTIDVIRGNVDSSSHNLNSIVSRIRPVIETLCESNISEDEEELKKYSIRANVRASVGHIRYSSPILEKLVQQERVTVVGAEYSLETGVVNFID
ncbi:carbonic anhydrase [Reinekea marina]|uniref:carbonic anhydrase n=1 Tax=Reinekea marina TaxID=1310421 RepID=A0ABV7WUP8_9GAMM|nr:carbonic anhydrase [Reinekea marina]MDN3650143.1 carbonic anhydrase [Reinekea marina]